MQLPKQMQFENKCIICKKIMKITNSFLRKDESAVEVWHKCECGADFGFAYTNGFINQFKAAMNTEPIAVQDIEVE